jgi:short-subunit dehydrogenase
LRTGTALITGASSGIGQSYARSLAASGYNVIITARREDRLQKLSEDMAGDENQTVEILTADLSTPEGMKKVGARLGDESRPVDFLVHSAGFGTRGHLADLDENLITSMVNVHCQAGVTLARRALPGMIARNRGRIVLISSLGAFLTTAEYTLYSATKAFLNTIALGLRDELAATEVRVQAVCPGLVKTEFMETPAFGDFHYQSVPEKYWLKPEAVVTESRRRLDYRYKPIIVPGVGNRILLGMLNTPILGAALKAMMSASSRKRIRSGKPAIY